MSVPIRVLAEGAPRAEAALLSQILADDVVPALRRRLGGALVLPPHVTLARRGVPGDGYVHVDYAPDTGHIQRVVPPRLPTGHPPATLRWAVAHELGHYHELTTRMRTRLALPSRAAIGLWSEYFTVRLSAECGMGSPAELQGRTPVAVALGAETRPISGAHPAAYTMAWRLALADAGLGDHPLAREVNARPWAPGPFYQKFPRWSIDDAELVNRVFAALDDLASSTGE